MKQRFYSLDVFRGATVAFMILVNNPGSWSYIYSPLEHAPWNGCTPTDLVFPFFLFAVGNAMAFVLPRLEAAGPEVFLKKIFTRTLLIFGIGLFLNWFPFIKWSGDHLVFKNWADPMNLSDPGAEPVGIRILGVLQRIALAYCLASLILYYGKVRGAFFTGMVILLGYWVVCALCGDPADPYSLQGWFGTRVDKAILGVAHMYKGEGRAFDPEGLASTLPAVVQVIFGYLVGQYILQKGKTYEMIASLFVIGCVLVFAGFCWDMVFPINKKIWTSSFVVYSTGLAILVLCVLMYVIEMRGRRGVAGIPAEDAAIKDATGPRIRSELAGTRGEVPASSDEGALSKVRRTPTWSRFFDVFGKNALFIFTLSGILPRLLSLFHIPDGVNAGGGVLYKGLKEWLVDHFFIPAFGPMNGSLLYAIVNILLFWALCYWLDRKKIYIKV